MGTSADLPAPAPQQPPRRSRRDSTVASILRKLFSRRRTHVQRQVFRLVGGAFTVLWPQPGIGPNLGHVATDVIDEEQLRAALPSEPPPWELVEDVASELERAEQTKFA